MACCKNKIVFFRYETSLGFTFFETLSTLILISVLFIFIGFPIISELNHSRLDETVQYVRLISNASESHRRSVYQVSYQIPISAELKSIYRGAFVFSSQYRSLPSDLLDWNNPQVFSLAYLYDVIFLSGSFLDEKNKFYVKQTPFFSVVSFDALYQAEGLNSFDRFLKDSVHSPQNKTVMISSQYTKSPYLLDWSTQYIYKTHAHWQDFRL